MAQIDMNALLEAFQSAVTTAQHLCESQHQDEMDYFFEADGRPKTKRVLLKNMNGPGDVAIDVPLFTLIPHGSIRIKDMKIKFKTRISNVIEPQKLLSGVQPQSKPLGRESRMRLGVGLSGSTGSRWWPFGGKKEERDDLAEVEVTFSATDPPEGLVRVNDEIIKRFPV